MRILLVEDNPGDARLIRGFLTEFQSQDTQMAHVDCMSAAELYLSEHLVDVVLVDPGLRDAQGLESIQRVHSAAPNAALVVLTRSDDAALAAQAMHEGAQHYLIKGEIDPWGLSMALGYAVERKAMEAELFEEKERARVTLNCIGDAVACTDVFGTLTYLNVVAERLTGWSREEAAGRPMPEVMRIMDSVTRVPIPNPMTNALLQEGVQHLPPNAVLARRDGTEISIEDSVASIRDRTGKATGAVIIFRDVSTSRAMTLELAYAAEHDFLSGLPNRSLLKHRISEAITRAVRAQSQFAVLLMDINGFKHINDSLGHGTGDKLLRSIAARLINSISANDTVSRQGGDEFVVLLTEVGCRDDIVCAAVKMLDAAAEMHVVDQHNLHVTASIGISVWPNDGGDADTLIQNADTAMYQAKSDGRRGYCFFEPEMNARAVKRQSIEVGLRCALEEHQFVLHYQPKMNLRTGAISGAEALIRWAHPTQGLISPGEFISVAEACGLIVPIGAWALHEACTQAQSWIAAGLPVITMAVNVSAMELEDENFLKRVFDNLASTGFAASSLELELTESVLMKRAEHAASILRSLRQGGIRVAVDDFGTGYSSLSYLRKFSVDTLKIDQSFIRQISAVGEDTTLLVAVIALAQSLNLRVVAEGVETPQEVEFLREHHCDEVQGYYFSRPVPADQFASLLAQQFSPRSTFAPALEPT